MPHQTKLHEQQASRKQTMEGGNARGVVGKLDKPPVERWEDFDEDTFDKELFVRQLQRTSEAFQAQYPQIPIDESPAGQHNLRVIRDWLAAHGVAGNTIANLGACV